MSHLPLLNAPRVFCWDPLICTVCQNSRSTELFTGINVRTLESVQILLPAETTAPPQSVLMDMPL